MREWFVLLSLLVAQSAGATTYCADYFALAAFSPKQCELALSTFEGVKHPCIGVLWGTFGLNNFCLERFITRYGDKPHTIRIHATNETCRRPTKVCEKGREVNPAMRRGNYSRGLLRNPELAREVGRRVVSIRDWLSLHGTKNTRAILTTGLEDNFSRAAYEKVRDTFTEALIGSGILLARSPMASVSFGIAYGPSDFIELHGASVNANEWRDDTGYPPCIQSTDGTLFDPTGQGRILNGNGDVSFLWPALRDIASNYCDFVFIWSNSQASDKRLARFFVRPSKRPYRLDKREVKLINKWIINLEKLK